MQSSRFAGVLGVVCCAAVSTAHAHPVPALSPDFGAQKCITVVDKRSEPMLAVDYMNGYDDVMEEPDHIPVPDQKTHQFFAFRGQLSASDPVYTYAPFDPTMDAPINMPLWLNQADLMACDAKNTPMIAPQFSPMVIGADTLTERPDMMGQWLNVRETRVPITERQGMLGMRWMLADVPAGVYTVTGYIYSPPFNAWGPRDGVIKVIDGTRDVPAVTLDSVDASLFEGQGRKVGGCVDAPAGTMLQVFARVSEVAGSPWEMWGSQPTDDTGRFEFCYRSPMPGFAGIMQLKVVATSPDGETTVAYAPDSVVLIPNPSKCTPGPKLCCDMSAAAAMEAAATSADPSAPGAGTLTQPAVATGAAGSAGAGVQPAAAGAMAGQPAMAQAPAASSGGCSVQAWPSEHKGCWSLLLLAAAGLLRRKRR